MFLLWEIHRPLSKKEAGNGRVERDIRDCRLRRSRVSRRLDRRVLRVRGRWLGYFQLGRAREHLGEPDTNTLDNREEDSAADGTVSRGLVASSDGKGTTGEEAGDDSIIGILLLANTLHSAVEGREETTPDAKVAAEDRRSHLDSGNGANTALTVGRVSESLDSMPDSTADGL